MKLFCINRVSNQSSFYVNVLLKLNYLWLRLFGNQFFFSSLLKLLNDFFIKIIVTSKGIIMNYDFSKRHNTLGYYLKIVIQTQQFFQLAKECVKQCNDNLDFFIHL